MNTLHILIPSLIATTLLTTGCPAKQEAPASSSSPGDKPEEHSHPHAHGSASTAPSGASNDVKQPGEAKLGDRTWCTVHREHQIVVTENSPHVDYKGKTYYFCCETCAGNFKSHPEQYIH